MPEAGSQSRKAPEAGDLAGAFALISEMMQAFAASGDLQATLDRALESIVDHLSAEAGSLWLLEEDRELVCYASSSGSDIRGTRLAASQGIIGRCVRENSDQSVLDARSDPAFAPGVDQQSGFETRSLLCAPMSFDGHPLGAIELLNKRSTDGRFAEVDAHVLRVLASSAALAIANARMAASLAEHEVVRRELELAADIQRNLLPEPRPAPFPVYAMNLPARTVSGDFFDIVPFADGRIGFCLGDVAGKGMNAALLMAQTASLYRCLVKALERPGELLHALNDELCETTTRGLFVTMVAGVFEPKTGLARLANAGHEPPLRRSPAGEFADFPAEAPPLGIVPHTLYPEVEVRLATFS